MRRLISIAFAFLIYSFAPAFAQTDLLVVQTCGTLPLAYVPGAVRLGTQDVNGNMCGSTAPAAGGATAANQVLQITQETAINTVLGLQADAACSTDNGTCTIAALFKRNNQNITTGNTSLASIVTNTTGLATSANQTIMATNQTSVQAPVAPGAATATKANLTACQATSVAINPTTGQQGAVNCDLNNNLLVSSGGAPNLTTAQVSIATSNTVAVAARALRRNVTITNITGTQQIYCSGTTATTNNGQLIPAVIGASWNVSTTAAINCIAVTGAQTVSVSEIY